MKKNQHILKQKMIFIYQGSTTYLPEINANCCFFLFILTLLLWVHKDNFRKLDQRDVLIIIIYLLLVNFRKSG